LRPMTSNGQLQRAENGAHVLRWPGRVVVVEDLRRALNGHGELVLTENAVVTPLAAEHLRALGIQVTRRAPEAMPAPTATWGYGQDRPHSLVSSAIQSLRRDGVALKELTAEGGTLTCQWAKAMAECVARGDCRGAVVFCQDPALVCCVANKVAGLRAASVASVAQSAKAALTLGANLVAVDMLGRTFFEIRQMLRTLCVPAAVLCPAELAHALKELESNAHR